MGGFYDYNSRFLVSCSCRGPVRPRYGLPVLQGHEKSSRRQPQNESHRPLCAGGGVCLPEASIQDRLHRLYGAVRGIRGARFHGHPESLCAGGVPYRRFLQRPVRFFGNEDCHLRKLQNGAGRHEQPEPWAGHRLQKRGCHGPCGGRVWPAGYFGVVYLAELHLRPQRVRFRRRHCKQTSVRWLERFSLAK